MKSLLRKLTDFVRQIGEGKTQELKDKDGEVSPIVRRETNGILESLSEGVVATDTSGKVTFCNEAASRLLGAPRNAILGQSLETISGLYPDLVKQCHDLVLHSLQTDEKISENWTLRTGNSLYLSLTCTPLIHLKGALLVLQDKTSDYKIVELGKDFVANASHELRTPITIIRGFAETLQDIPNLSPEMLHEIMEKIVRTCGRLDNLVKSLLTLADIENFSTDRFKEIDLMPLVENCKHLLLTAHPKAKVIVIHETEQAIVRADGDLLELALFNLLENSVKYSAKSPSIEIEISHVGDQVHLSVRDRGIGISEKDLSHVFDRFYTVDKARSRKLGGAGLGLSIVKMIVEKHKGKVIVASELGKGSEFTIILKHY